MRAIYIPEKGKTIFDDREKPVCTDTGIIIKTMYSGLSNGTERNVLMGGNYGGGFPRYPGYQIIGEVVECGAKVSKFSLGDIVYCANTGFGHGEFVPAEQGSLLIKLKENDDLEVMSLLAIASVAYRNTMRLNVKHDERVIVYGGAVIGQVAAQVAQNCGAKVTLIAGDPDKLAGARDCGIYAVWNRHEKDFEEKLQSGKPWDCCLETSGADVLETIIGTSWGGGLLAYEGRLALVAGRDTISYSSNAAQSKALLLFQSAHFKQPHLEKVAAQVRSGKIKIKPLIKDTVPIDDAIAIYDRLRDDRSSLFGTVFKWN